MTGRDKEKSGNKDQLLVGRATLNLTFPKPPPPVEFRGDSRVDARIQYYGTLYGSDSFANVAGVFAHALVDRLDNVSVCNYLGGEIDDPALAPHGGLNYRAPIGIFFGLPSHVPPPFYEHILRIGIFVCETDQVLPEWVRACNRLHLLVVPSAYCRDAFRRSGVTTPIMVVPHGVHPSHQPLAGLRRGDRFVFYNSFRHQVAMRKGYAELVRCFQRAFQGRDDVLLRLRAGDRNWLPAVPGAPDFGGLVEFDGPEALSMSEAAAVYSQVHCVVHPSKAEGFGLVPLESMACETPVISPAHSGMADYLTEDNAMVLRHGGMIRAQRTEIQCGRWYAVDEEHLVERLRDARDHWDAERDKVAQVAGAARRTYAWQNVLRPFLEIVENALECDDSWEFSRLTAPFRDPAAEQGYYEEAGRRARFVPAPDAGGTDRPEFRFSNLVYCGWDYPRDGVGNHVRLLDGLIFNSPGIRYKSLDELPAAYDPDLYPGLASYVHEQRPDLFRDGLYLDVVGFHGDQGVIRRQIDRVTDIKRRAGARTAIYLMWESDALWAPMLEQINAYDLTIVTSSLLDAYLRPRGVRYVRLPHPYRYEVTRPREDRDPATITMGISAGLWPRKNLALVAETFAQVLGNRPGFRLVVHTRTTPRYHDEILENERIEEAARSVDNVDYQVGSLTRQEYLDWMRSLDVYCFMSAGEGWSVTPREALHLGKPVVLLDAHVHADFSHLPGVIPVAPGEPQPARPGVWFIDSGIGHEAGVNRHGFAAVLDRLRDCYLEARGTLVSRFDEVLDYHRVETIRNQWVTTLNKFF